MASPFVDYPSILRHLETRLLVADLKDILKELHLSTSGNKRPLIDRVASHLGLLKSANDVARYTSLKNRILRCGSPSMPMPMARGIPPRSNIPVAGTNDYRPTTNGMPYSQFAGSHWRLHGQVTQQQSMLNFRPSPFYEVVERLSNTATLPFSSRNTVSVSFVCSMNALDLLHQGSPRYKVAIMCADSTFAYNPNRQLLLEFPNPAEVLVNTRRLHANLKGMKNRPGTIPPADITSYIDRTPRLANRIDITYTCGSDVNKKYGVQVVLLKTHSVDELVEKVKSGNRFTKESVLAKLRKPEDDDIEMASFDLTLKDPLSYMRITVPCRSTFCKHNQCWDAMAFLSINEQTPQWTCPICHVAINGLSSIAVDGYFQDILDKVGQDVDSILVDPQGNWKLPGADTETEDAKSKNRNDNDDTEHEVLDLQDTEDEEDVAKSSIVKLPHMKQEIDSRPSTPMIAARPIKRKASPVCIDLTEDSDEEIEPPKRVKHSDSMVLPTAPAMTPTVHRASLPDLPSSAHALPTIQHDERLHLRASEPTNGFRHPSDDQERIPPWRLPEPPQQSPSGTSIPEVPQGAIASDNIRTTQSEFNINGDHISTQGVPEVRSMSEPPQQQLPVASSPSRTLDHVSGDGSAAERQANMNHSDKGEVSEYLSSAFDPTTSTVTNVLGSATLAPSTSEDRPDDYSPPVVIPGSNRTVNLPQPQALFSDDFSDGDQDIY